MLQDGPTITGLTGIRLEDYAYGYTAQHERQIITLAHLQWFKHMEHTGLIVMPDGATVYDADKGYTIPEYSVLDRYAEAVLRYLDALGYTAKN